MGGTYGRRKGRKCELQKKSEVKEARHKGHPLYSSMYETWRIGNPWRQKADWLLPGARGGGMRSDCLWGGASFWDYGNVLELDSGGGYITL